MTDERAPNVVEAVNRVQADLKAVAKSGQMEDGQRKFSFRRIDDLMEAIHHLLAAHCVVINPRMTAHAIDTHHYKNSTAYLHTVHVDYEVRGPGGLDDMFVMQSIAVGIDSGDKGPGKALSYAYKQAVSQLLSIPTHDPDMDNEATTHEHVDWYVGNGWPNQAAHDEQKAEFRRQAQALPEAAQETLKAEMADHTWPTDPKTLTGLLRRVAGLAAEAGQEPFETDAEAHAPSRSGGREPDVEATAAGTADGSDGPPSESGAGLPVPAQLPESAQPRTDEPVSEWLDRLTDQEHALLSAHHGINLKTRPARNARLLAKLTEPS